jgi:hypothetical protein
MAQRNAWVLLTTGLARMEGENVMYIRASDNVSGYSSAPFPSGCPADPGHTATHAVVPLHCEPGFNLERSGRPLYQRPPFTGCG